MDLFLIQGRLRFVFERLKLQARQISKRGKKSLLFPDCYGETGDTNDRTVVELLSCDKISSTQGQCDHKPDLFFLHSPLQVCTIQVKSMYMSKLL
jgi:hypothetical protein